MADDTSALLRALARIDALRIAAANAAPAIDELLAVGMALELSEAEAYSAIGINRNVAVWCRKVQRQGMQPVEEQAAAQQPTRIG
jgi:hypothetical protein